MLLVIVVSMSVIVFPKKKWWGDPIGANISERKSGTERTKKRKKRELVFFPIARVATGTLVHRIDATRILPELR